MGMSDSQMAKAGTLVPAEQPIKNPTPRRAGVPTGDFGCVCTCGEQTFRYHINHGGHYSHFDRCPTCCKEFDVED